MARKRTAQLDQEIRKALAKVPKNPGLKTREQLDAEIDAVLAGGLPAERYEVARALGFQYPKRPPPKTVTLTDLNLWVLGRIAHGRKEFPNKITSTSSEHLRRAMKAGAVEVVDKTRLRITPAGHAALMNYIATYPGKADILPPISAYSADVFE